MKNPKDYQKPSPSPRTLRSKSRALFERICGLAALGMLAPQAFGVSPAEMSCSLSPTGKVLKASWPGVPDRTYFLQYSTDLVHWEYSPQVQKGTGEILKDGFDAAANRNLFIRQIYTDESTANPETADFDQDGIANIVELQRGTDPFNAESGTADPSGQARETTRSKLILSNQNRQRLVNGQVLDNASTGSTSVVLSGNATGEVTAEGIVWGGGVAGNYRGLLNPPVAASGGQSSIMSFMTTGQGDVNSIMGFTSTGSLNGLMGTGGMSLTLQRTANNYYNRILSNSGSGSQWVEMTQIIATNTRYRAMIRKEPDGFSSWIQGGLFSDMGAKVDSAVWFPISRWKGVNPTASIRAGIYNSFPGHTLNSEFSSVENPTIDSTSALLDYERNKLGLHIPSLSQLPDGRVLAAWQIASSHETADGVIRMAIRNSRGVWGPSVTVITTKPGEANVGPVLNQVGDQIWLTYLSITNDLYKVKKQLVSITQNGFTLSDNPQVLFENGLLLNHMLTLPSGRIVACWHTSSSIWKNMISYSDDGGTSWKPANIPQFANRAGEGFAIIEADGTLASYWRTDRTAIYRSTSNDDGRTWTALKPTAIPCANMPSQGLLGSRVCGYKRPSDGKVVIVGNNSTTQREKLTAWLVNNGEIEGIQSLLPWDLPDGSAEGIQYPDVVVGPDDSMTVIASRWLGGGNGSAELHSAINTFKVKADFK
ncbi:exo-alpha-sialidase [Luteolibacter yonseiensis]|uniref:Exo-alpha-sialidase n=1 Tax=Luteolibacter yonseiensis TaxID=1144680 RepID=A0A934R129_9BACT|nr:exo-alpha-sialidase [Luteolibacter yonseiensis]MBK1814396.1 exo-alpha-sialidase [Luteolibacter yonseiensis]